MSTKPDSEALEIWMLKLHETRLCLATLITLVASREGVASGMSSEQIAERWDRLREFVFEVDQEQREFLEHDKE